MNSIILSSEFLYAAMLNLMKQKQKQLKIVINIISSCDERLKQKERAERGKVSD